MIVMYGVKRLPVVTNDSNIMMMTLCNEADNVLLMTFPQY